MTTFIDQAKVYAVYHQKPFNRYIQMIGISLIILACLTVLACIHITIPSLIDVSLACVATLALLLYYARLNWLLALTITPLFALLCWIASIFSYPAPTVFTLWIGLIALVLGALVCFAGYYIEGKRPSPKDSLQQLIISPLMMAADLVFMTGRQRELRDEIYGKDAAL